MVKSLLEAFQSIPDPRGKYGQRHSLPAILTLATAAMLRGACSLYTICQWGQTPAAFGSGNLGLCTKEWKAQGNSLCSYPASGFQAAGYSSV